MAAVQIGVWGFVGVVASFYTSIKSHWNSSCHLFSSVVCMLPCSRVLHIGSSSLETSTEPLKMPDLQCHLHVTTLTNFILLLLQEPPIPKRATRLHMQNKIKLNQKLKEKKEETNENYEISDKIKYYSKEKQEKMRN